MTTSPPSLPELKVVSDMLRLIFLNHTGPITPGISCHFTFSSRVELGLGKPGAKESHLGTHSSKEHFGFSGGAT